MAIYKITFNQDSSAFETCIPISGYKTPQDYFKANANDRKCLLVEKKKNSLYMVIYYKKGESVATLPWKNRNNTWLKDYSPWNTDVMNNEDSWVKAVIERFPELSIENVSPKKSTEKKRKKTKETTSDAVAPILKFDFNYWNNNSESEVLDYLFERARCVYNSAKKAMPQEVVGNIPILWFGNYEAYKNSEIKVVTVGLNPSSGEFEEERFPLLFSRSVNDINAKEYFEALNRYFAENPLWNEWFMSYNDKLAPWNAGYRNMTNTALHIDCWSPCATSPVWSGLERTQQEYLMEFRKDADSGNDIFVDLVNFLKPDILLIPDSYWKCFRTPDFQEITEMRDLFQDKIDSDTANNRWAALHFYKSSTLSVISGPNRSVPFSNIKKDETLRLFDIFVGNYFNSKDEEK